MILSEFVKEKKVDYSKDLVNIDVLKDIEKELGTRFGNELTQYFLEYGYLAYKHVELYGINSKQLSESDLVKQTKYLHKYFLKTDGLIALENVGDGIYILISSNDDVYEFSSESYYIHHTGLKLFDYILSRFQEIDD